MLAFRESIDMGAQMVELDTRLSRDGVPMVFHDRTLRRMADGRSGSVAKMTAASLAKVDLGNGVRIPTLAEVLLALTPEIPVNIELKYNRYEYRSLMTGVADVIESLGVQKRVVVSSFFKTALHFLERRLPEVEVAHLFGILSGPPHPEDLEAVFARELIREGNELPFAGRIAVVDHTMIDEDLARTFEEAEATLLTYTVDEPEDMKRLIGLGIDGIITNKPSRLVALLDEMF